MIARMQGGGVGGCTEVNSTGEVQAEPTEFKAGR